MTTKRVIAVCVVLVLVGILIGVFFDEMIGLLVGSLGAAGAAGRASGSGPGGPTSTPIEKPPTPDEIDNERQTPKPPPIDAGALPADDPDALDQLGEWGDSILDE